MNRRDFLKRLTGFSLGLTAAQFAIPAGAKCQLVAPMTDLVANTFLDARIEKNIAKLKRENPSLVIGETHCHSTFSDGTRSVNAILNRAAKLGLDYVVLTEHLIPRKYPLEFSLASIRERQRCVREWENGDCAPVKVYPAFEVSTLQGHLILVFDETYLKPEKFSEIKTQFSLFDSKMISMEDTARLVEPLGGISIIAHPEKNRRYPFGVPIAFAKEHLTGLVDGIEDISTGHGYAESFSEEVGMASIGSSDDHFNLIIGTTVTGYDAGNHSSLISAVKARETRAIKVEDSLDHLLIGARLIL